MISAFVGFGFSSFFILGYYLNRKELSPRTRACVYTLGIVAFFFTFLYYWYESYRNLARRPNFFFPDGYFTVNFILMGAAMFVLAKKLPLKRNRFVEILANYSFGAYLVHYLVIKVVSFPLISILTIVISFSISALLHRIPVVNKYLV